jgi:hypothetical protein
MFYCPDSSWPIQAPPVDASAVSSYDEYEQQQQLTAYNSNTALQQQEWSCYEDDAGNPYWYVCMHACMQPLLLLLCMLHCMLCSILDSIMGFNAAAVGAASTSYKQCVSPQLTHDVAVVVHGHCIVRLFICLILFHNYVYDDVVLRMYLLIGIAL